MSNPRTTNYQVTGPNAGAIRNRLAQQTGNAILTIDPLKAQSVKSRLERMGLQYGTIGNNLLTVDDALDRLAQIERIPGVESAVPEGQLMAFRQDGFSA